VCRSRLSGEKGGKAMPSRKTDLRTKQLIGAVVADGVSPPAVTTVSWQAPESLDIIGFELTVEIDMPIDAAIQEGEVLAFAWLSRGGLLMYDSMLADLRAISRYYTEIVGTTQIAVMHGDLTKHLVIMFPQGFSEKMDRDDVINLHVTGSAGMLASGSATIAGHCILYYVEK
jgi:hypothetical protein